MVFWGRPNEVGLLANEMSGRCQAVQAKRRINRPRDLQSATPTTEQNKNNPVNYFCAQSNETQ